MLLGITKKCVGTWGKISWKARSWSSSKVVFAGISLWSIFLKENHVTTHPGGLSLDDLICHLILPPTWPGWEKLWSRVNNFFFLLNLVTLFLRSETPVSHMVICWYCRLFWSLFLYYFTSLLPMLPKISRRLRSGSLEVVEMIFLHKWYTESILLGEIWKHTREAGKAGEGVE